ncbi:hypothetical protein ACFL6M_05910 [Candidatus Eisenbacteria bacterium]|uniref:Peptidase C39-like domain-containing protein n=1 Tax=Eiseniibacteriota bacterium TaxID=2212470 RepID=A0ABV6YLB0_UNCEI
MTRPTLWILAILATIWPLNTEAQPPVDIGRTYKNRAYADTLTAIDQRRRALHLEYQAVPSESARAVVFDKVHEEIGRSVVHGIMPFWYGTRWDFNGITQEPDSCCIACGYYVTTLLRDVGFVLERARLAQQASEFIILSLVRSASVRRFSDTPLEAFVRNVEQWGHGLYVVGLDIHVGFIVCDDQGVHFIHSAYRHPLCVIREEASESLFLRVSRYRVLGKLTGEHDLAVKWLTGERICTRTE